VENHPLAEYLDVVVVVHGEFVGRQLSDFGCQFADIIGHGRARLSPT
jgi:hypothetical protein